MTEPMRLTGSVFLAADTMRHKYLQIASTPSVKSARAKYGSAKQYARLDGSLDPDCPTANDRLIRSVTRPGGSLSIAILCEEEPSHE